MCAKASLFIRLLAAGVALSLVSAALAQENTAPTVPGDIQISEITANSARLTWGASTDANGDAVTYLVALRKRVGGVAQAWSAPRESRTTSIICDGLSAGTIYEVQVKATDGKATSAARAKENAFTTLGEVAANHEPSVPGAIEVSNVTARGARVSWGASTDPDGNPIVYLVSLRKRVEGVAQEWLAARESATTSVAYDGLDPETQYEVRVRASDGQAFSAWLVKEFAFRTLALNNGPTKPGEITVSEITARSARIAWEPATAPGPNQVSYEIMLRKRIEGVAQAWVRVGESLNTYRVVEGLSAGTIYDVEVRAWANAVASAYTVKESAFTTLAATDVNSAPTGPELIEVGNITSGSARISWGASTDADGNPITYAVSIRKRIEGVAQAWSDARSVTATSVVWEGLSPNTLYEIRVRASDGKSASNYRIKENAFRTLPVSTVTGSLETGSPTDPRPKLVVIWPVSGTGVLETTDSLQSSSWSRSQEVETDGVQNRVAVPTDSNMRFFRVRQ